jgi:hypothetical protein
MVLLKCVFQTELLVIAKCSKCLEVTWLSCPILLFAREQLSNIVTNINLSAILALPLIRMAFWEAYLICFCWEPVPGDGWYRIPNNADGRDYEMKQRNPNQSLKRVAFGFRYMEGWSKKRDHPRLLG